MHKLTVAVLCVLSLFAVASPVQAQSLKKLAKKLPQPTPITVLDLLDTLTRKDSGVRKKAKLLAGVGQQELIVYKTRVNVTLENSSSNFRGAVEVQVSMAADVRFVVDLDDVRIVGWDRQRRILKIKLPPVKVGIVSRDEDSRDVRRSYRRGRFKLYDSDVAGELESAILKEKFDDQAREEAASKLSDARKQARIVVRDFVARFLRLQDTDTVIQVE